MSPVKSSGASYRIAATAMIGDHVVDLAWSHDGRILAAAAVGGPIALFDSAALDVVRTLPGHGFGTMSLSWNPRNAVLASSGQDGLVRIWNDGTESLELDAGAAWATKATWSPDGQTLATAAGRILRLWDAEGRPLNECPDHPSTIADIAWKPASAAGPQPILATAAYGLVTLWHPGSSAPARQFSWKGSSLVLAWSPNGTYLATGDQDCTVHFWITETGKDLQMWGYEQKVLQLSWDATGRYLATGGGSSIAIWDCSGKGPEGRKPIQLGSDARVSPTRGSHERPVSVLAYQNKGGILASGGRDGKVVLWNPTARKPYLGEFKTASGITKLAWSPEDDRLAIGTESGGIMIVNSGMK